MCSSFLFGDKNDKLLGVKECAVHLGISKYTLYGWVNQRQIPYVKVGNLVKFRMKEIEKWLDNRTVWPFEFPRD